MTSLLTNGLASATLRQMRATQSDLQQVQDQASSGLRVSAASDNAAYWSIGVAMRSEVGALSSVQDGLALSSSIATITNAALTTIISQMSGIKDDLVAAHQPGVDAAAVDLDIKAKQQQIITTANSASFNGQNWLVGQLSYSSTLNDTATYDQSSAVVSRINRNASPSTESYTVSSVAQQTFTLKDERGTVTEDPREATSQFTYTDTVATVGGVTQKTLTRSTGPGTNYQPFTDVVATANPISIVNGYETSSGVSTASIPRTAFRLFSNNTGKVTETNMTNYTDRTVDNNLAEAGTHEIVLGASQSASYNTPFIGGAGGLLDQSLVVTNGSSSALTSLLNMSTVGANETDLNTMLQATENALATLTTAAALVGAVTTRIAGQTTFNAAMSDALKAGVGSLTDADMNTTATRIQALQTQQQLQIQALSIANQNTNMILRLFA